MDEFIDIELLRKTITGKELREILDKESITDNGYISHLYETDNELYYSRVEYKYTGNSVNIYEFLYKLKEWMTKQGYFKDIVIKEDFSFVEIFKEGERIIAYNKFDIQQELEELITYIDKIQREIKEKSLTKEVLERINTNQNKNYLFDYVTRNLRTIHLNKTGMYTDDKTILNYFNEKLFELLEKNENELLNNKKYINSFDNEMWIKLLLNRKFSSEFLIQNKDIFKKNKDLLSILVIEQDIDENLIENFKDIFTPDDWSFVLKKYSLDNEFILKNPEIFFNNKYNLQYIIDNKSKKDLKNLLKELKKSEIEPKLKREVSKKIKEKLSSNEVELN